MQVFEFNKHWVKVFWNMADGDKTKMNSLRSSDCIEFWYLYDEYEAEIERKKQQQLKH